MFVVSLEKSLHKNRISEMRNEKYKKKKKLTAELTHSMRAKAIKIEPTALNRTLLSFCILFFVSLFFRNSFDVSIFFFPRFFLFFVPSRSDLFSFKQFRFDFAVFNSSKIPNENTLESKHRTFTIFQNQSLVSENEAKAIRSLINRSIEFQIKLNSSEIKSFL